MRNNQDNNKITLTDLLGEDTLILKKINVGKSTTSLDTYCDFTLTLNKSNLTTDLYDSINNKTSKECQELIKFKELKDNVINITFNDKPFAFTISGLSVYTSKGNDKKDINVNKNTFSNEILKNGLLTKLKETIANKMQQGQPLAKKIEARQTEELEKQSQQKKLEQQEKKRLLQQQEEQNKIAAEQQKKLQITAAKEAFEKAEKELTGSNTSSKESLKIFNEGEENGEALLKAVEKVQNNFKTLEEQATKLNTLNQEAKISAEFKDQKLYADFLNQNLKQGALDKQSDFMKGLSGEFYKPFERLSKILKGNNNKITVTDDIKKILEDNKDKGFAFGGQIENNLETFFKRLEEKIKKGPENTLQQHCKAVSLTLDSNTGTGKTMFMESLLGSKNEKDQYYTNQQYAGGFKKEGLGDLGALIYGKGREKFVIHCGLVGFEDIKKQINTSKDAIMAFDEWHLLTKEQKIELKPLLDGKNVIKITATPTDGLYKTLKKGDAGKKKQDFLSEKEERKAKVLENVGKANDDISKLASADSYCLSIIDAESKVFGDKISNHKTGESYNFAEIFDKNLEGIKFNEGENQKPEVIICPPKDGKNVIYVLEKEKYKYKEVDKNTLTTELMGKKRVFQVFGPSSQEEAKNSRGNIDGGDNGTSSIKNPKILFYSLDNKIVEKLGELLKQGEESLGNEGKTKQKAQLVNLINKYDEFIVQAYGRARADTNDIKFKEESAKILHDQIQAKKAELLKEDSVFKTKIGKDTLVDYQSFVDRFKKNLPQGEREKIITQAFLKVASEENNSEKKEGSLKVEIDPIKDPKRFNEAYNIIKSLTKEQREALMNIGGYDKEGLEQQKTALETIKATIEWEIKEKRVIYNINAQNYTDFSSKNKIENKITIKIDKDGKVSLLGVDKVTQFESKKYLNENIQKNDTKLNEVDANAFKKLIEEHIKGINKEEVKSAQDEYLKTIKEINGKLQGLDLTPEQKELKEKAKENLEKVLELDTKLSKEEVKEMIDKLDKSAESQVALQLLQKEKGVLNKKKTENDEKIKQLQEDPKSKGANSEENKAEIDKFTTTNQELQDKLNQNQLDINENQKKIEELEKKLTEANQQKETSLEEKDIQVMGAADENYALSEKLEKLKQQLEQQKLEAQQKQSQLEAEKEKLLEKELIQKDNLVKLGNKKLEELKIKQEKAQLVANNEAQKLQDELNKKDQKIIQLEQNHLEKLKEKDKDSQTQAELNEQLEAQIAEILKNKGSDRTIDALFDDNNPKKLYHTADSFDKIGQSNVGFGYGENYYKEALEKDKDQDKFDSLRKSIIQSSAIRDKHSILQEVLQEKGSMTDGLEAYKFKSLDELIDGDNFKPEFKAELERLGFGKGENGIWAKGEGENAVKYDTSQPYVKDFLINAYYEENFNKFKETLEASLAKDKSPTLEELKASAIARYNTKQKLEFVEQVVNYQAVLTNDKARATKNIDENQLNDYIQIANIITNNNQNYEERFKSEHNEEIQKLEKNAIAKGSMKIEVGASASLLVNVNDSKEDELEVPNERDVVNKVPTFIKINSALLHMIGKNDTNQKTSDDSDLKTSNSIDENASAHPIPGSLIKPEGFKNLLQDSLVKHFESFKALVSSSNGNKNGLPNANRGNNNNQLGS